MKRDLGGGMNLSLTQIKGPLPPFFYSYFLLIYYQSYTKTYSKCGKHERKTSLLQNQAHELKQCQDFNSFRIYPSKFLTAEWDWWAFRTGSASAAFLATINCNICFRYLLMMSSKASWCSSKETHSSIKKQNNLAVMSEIPP